MGEKCETEVCAAHSGQNEKIRSAFAKVNLLVWMMGGLIFATITVGGVLYASVQSVQITMAGYSSQLNNINERLRMLDAADQRLSDRLDRLEGIKR